MRSHKEPVAVLVTLAALALGAAAARAQSVSTNTPQCPSSARVTVSPPKASGGWTGRGSGAVDLPLVRAVVDPLEIRCIYHGPNDIPRAELMKPMLTGSICRVEGDGKTIRCEKFLGPR